VDGGTTTERKYYSAGSKRIAMRVNGTLTWLLGDHLGSTSVTAQADGTFQSEMRYTAFGETRSSSGPTLTDYQYTGQRHEAEFGLYFYKARWYDPASAHFTQADTMVPEEGNPLSLDRFSYTYNNPLRYIDPTGHVTCHPDICDMPEDDPVNPPQITEDPEIIWELIITGAGLLDDVNQNISYDIKSKEIFIILSDGFNFKTIKYTTPGLYMDDFLRGVGRGVGNIDPLTSMIGIGLCVSPELIENISKGATASEYKADLIIDVGGFFVADIMGKSFGTMLGALSAPEVGEAAPIVGIVGGFVVDVSVGYNYDYMIEENQIRESLTKYFENQPNPPQAPEPQSVPHPGNNVLNVKSTPVP
jgi:RHS repeat-associated protein